MNQNKMVVHVVYGLMNSDVYFIDNYYSATFTLERNSVIIVFKNVPAMVCTNCSDFYLTEETTRLLLEKASKTAEKGVEFEIINFKPAA